MNDRPTNAARMEPEPHDDFASDQAIENAALAGAAAVQRLVAERNNLRNRLAAQQRELGAMRAFNEELRRRFYILHQRYVEVAKRVVGELEQFDGTLREVIQDRQNGAVTRQDAQAAASLVRRLAETEEQPLDLDNEADAPQQTS